MTWELATHCESWAMTYVLDADILPRLSVLTLEDLRDEVLKLVGRLQVPKYQVFQTFLNRRRRGCGSGESGGGYYDYAHGELADLNQVIDDLPRYDLSTSIARIPTCPRTTEAISWGESTCSFVSSSLQVV